MDTLYFAPITAFYTAIFSLVYIVLIARVMSLRMKLHVSLGDGTWNSHKQLSIPDFKRLQISLEDKAESVRIIAKAELLRAQQFIPLTKAVRAHSNFAENVPFSLFLLALYEINHTESYWIPHILGLVLLIARIMHAEKGLSESGSADFRLISMSIQMIYYISLAALLIYDTAPMAFAYSPHKDFGRSIALLESRVARLLKG